MSKEHEHLQAEKTEEAEVNKSESQAEFQNEEDVEEDSSFSPLKIVFITVLTIVILGIVTVGVGGYYVYSNLQPVDQNTDEKVKVEIPLGSSAKTIASVLKENNIIRDEKIFYYYVRYKGASNFQAGEYYLSPRMELAEIIEQLKTGKMYIEGIKFTVPEGLSVEQVATHLGEKGIVNKEKFLQLVNEGDFSDISIVAEIPAVKERKYRLEGLLFPETYEINKDASEEEIIRKMLTQFESELEKSGLLEQIKQSKMSLYEAIILASIVEREAVLDQERSTISGIFHNRIQKEMFLQSCATVQFVLGKQRDRLLFEDLDVDSPYNTYKNAGLPPSPIASPGRASLTAAIDPETHEFFYFVTKKDGTGAHHFSKTYEEHLKNDAQSRGNF